uniref:Glycosyl transferase group 1 n=1 Tax=mine drainage metagenome TaxID=410659 RepID=E6QMG1_9ZZZZ
MLRGLTACFTLPAYTVSFPLRLAYLAEALLLGRWMRGKGLTRFHVHFGGPVSSVGLLTALAWRIPWSITFHGPGEFHAEDQCWLRPKLLSARHVFAISEFTRSQLLRIAPESEPKVSVIRLGVRSSLLAEARTEDTSQTGPLKIVCTGRLVPAKGQRVLLRAFAALPEHPRFRLTFIGDGPDRKHLEQLGRELGIEDRIEWLGALNHDATLRCVAGARIFVLASFAEGLPVALMEAMALGVPCISTYIAGIPELIHNEKNGLLVPAGSVEALTTAIKRLIGEPDLRERLTGCAKKTIAEEYLLESNHRALAAAMRRVWGVESGDSNGS